ncbi:hypothetical protein [Peribacillus tepidiphilus]|jgi:hypothetical protein|uniref:hypothetical protein n=1 Tax=Peribacillus tepidiphilus TaxID=2652445 RepID=UPI00129161BA|nr:hypothetical protein [Peribacillus tepidiphilus]
MSKAENWLDTLPFEITDEERKQWEQEFIEFQQKTESEKEDIPNPFLEKDKVIVLDKKRKKRKLSEVGESINLFHEVVEKVNEEENEKGATTLQDESSQLNELERLLLDYKLEFNLNIQIDVKRKCYTTIKDNQEIALSNFVILPLYSIEDEEGKRKDIIRIFNNRENKIVTLDAETKSINRQFKTFVLGNGKFHWLGSQKDLDQLVQLILSYETEEITEIGYVGWHEQERAWFFPTHAYINGEIYYRNEDKIFKTGKKNYILVENEAFNIIVEHVKDKPTKEEILSTLTNFEILYGTYGWLGIGFTTTSMHVNELAKKTKQHPFLYAHGLRNSGKTEFLKNVFRFAGMDTRLPPPPRLDGLRKRLAWFSHLPVGYDEAEEKSIKTMDFFVKHREALNTIFNRSPLERGTNDPNKLLYFPVRATLAFGGEVATSDSAITTRTVFIDALKINQVEQVFDELEENHHVIYWLGQYMMRTSHEWKPVLFDNFELINNTLKSIKEVSGRIRKNFAILVAGAITFAQWIDKEFGTQLYTDAFLERLLHEVEYEMKEGQKDAESNHHAITYLKDLAYLAHKYKLYKSDYKVEGNLLYIAPDSAWRTYEEWKKNPHYTSSRKVANDLKGYEFFLGTKAKRIEGKLYKCWVIDISKFPDEGLQGFLVDDCK